MEYLLGIDIGTSGTKTVLFDRDANPITAKTFEYPLYQEQNGWAEQEPEDWWNAVVQGVQAVLQASGVDAADIKGIGLSGQMHGLVMLDENGEVLRRSIIWCDQRTGEEVEDMNRMLGAEKIIQITANPAVTGFTAAKIFWVKKHEPELFARIGKIMLPKDYLVYCLTGVHATDYSDASGMLLLDVEHKCWSRDMLALCGISESQMPRLYESFAPVGTLLPETAAALGLPQGVTVCAGAGDNAAAAVGTGTVSTGAAHADSRCNISLGTSGTIFISSEKFGVDATNGLHAFAHADGG